MFTIDFSDHTGLVKDDWYRQIEDLLEFAKNEEHIEDDAELSVTFVDKRKFKKLIELIVTRIKLQMSFHLH